MALLGAPVRGIWRERKIFQKWWFFLALLGAPVRGIWRERKSFKSGGFFGKNGCTSKGYVVRETSLTLLKRERIAFQGSLCLPQKSGGFFGKN